MTDNCRGGVREELLGPGWSSAGLESLKPSSNLPSSSSWEEECLGIKVLLVPRNTGPLTPEPSSNSSTSFPSVKYRSWTADLRRVVMSCFSNLSSLSVASALSGGSSLSSTFVGPFGLTVTGSDSHVFSGLFSTAAVPVWTVGTRGKSETVLFRWTMAATVCSA